MTENVSGRTGRIIFGWEKILLRSLGNSFCLPWIVLSKVSSDRLVTLVEFLLYKLYDWKKPLNVKLANTHWDHISRKIIILCRDTLTKCLPVLQSSCVTTCQQDFILHLKAASRRPGSPSLSHSARIVRKQDVSSTLWVAYCWQPMLKRENCFLAWRDRNMRMGRQECVGMDITRLGHWGWYVEKQWIASKVCRGKEPLMNHSPPILLYISFRFDGF